MNAIKLFPNLDLAEGVLDAVMQVIVCTVRFVAIYSFAYAKIRYARNLL